MVIVALSSILLGGIQPSRLLVRREFARCSFAASSAALTFGTTSNRALAVDASAFSNDVIGYRFVPPATFAQNVAGGLFGRAAESLAFGGSVTFVGPDGAAIELTTQTLPPGPRYGSVDAFGSIDAAAERIIEGEVLSQRRERMGAKDAFLFESRTESERGFTAVSLKKDVNFANHMVVLSAHCPSGVWDAQRAALQSAVESLELDDFSPDASDPSSPKAN
mmetsp:Transcript_8376/g.21626  ORF Transcript_8376/g.21626 Transcript_8376/m.21626 type:complete len:221 (+) Transcript_8376:1-663(+)